MFLGVQKGGGVFAYIPVQPLTSGVTSSKFALPLNCSFTVDKMQILTTLPYADLTVRLLWENMWKYLRHYLVFGKGVWVLAMVAFGIIELQGKRRTGRCPVFKRDKRTREVKCSLTRGVSSWVGSPSCSVKCGLSRAASSVGSSGSFPTPALAIIMTSLPSLMLLWVAREIKPHSVHVPPYVRNSSHLTTPLPPSICWSEGESPHEPSALFHGHFEIASTGTRGFFNTLISFPDTH